MLCVIVLNKNLLALVLLNRRKFVSIKKVKYLLCDISKKNLLKKNIDKYYDYVINCGGYVNHYNKVQNYKTHYTGVKNLFSVFKNKKIKKFIQIGSSLEYGKTTPPNSEGDRCVPKMAPRIHFSKKIVVYLKWLRESIFRKRSLCT